MKDVRKIAPGARVVYRGLVYTVVKWASWFVLDVRDEKTGRVLTVAAKDIRLTE